MKTTILFSICVFVFVAGFCRADTFGTGDNQFEIDFVPISGSTNPASGYGIVTNDYRIGVYEITYTQWTKFMNAYGTLTGSPSSAYDDDTVAAISNRPPMNISWLEMAQFINWLNVSTNHVPAYKFTGTQGTGDYTFVPWEAADVGYDASNPFRNSNAYYFLPTEDEWVKAAYWNGTYLQTYSTIGDTVPVAGVDTNFDDAIGHSWEVGSGSEELNGTFDMMGNHSEWIESPRDAGDYFSNSARVMRGASYGTILSGLQSSRRGGWSPDGEFGNVGFRVASVIPEPATLLLLGTGGMLIRKR